MTLFHAKNRRKQNGYTLIELLLVVTVIAVIAALGVKTYRDKAESDRINIAALNIQHVLESAMSYNVANSGKWPENNWNPCSAGAAVQDQNFLKDYLPNESNQSNFGSPLCWSGDDPNDPSKPQKGPRFWVALNVGSDDTAIKTAQRIAARLPNAIIAPDPSVEQSTTQNSCTAGAACYVKAVVSVPSASTTAAQLTLAGAGNCDPSISSQGGDAAQQPGSGTGVFCKRTTLYDQFSGTSATVSGGDASLDSLWQYEIDFQCKPTETPNVYVTPNFVRMDRFSGQVKGKTVYTTPDPMYELSGAPQLNPYADATHPTPPYYVDYRTYCPAIPNPDGTVQCKVTMVATYNYENNTPLVAVGCTSHMQDEHICTCMTVGSDGSGGCADRPGTVGASYIAVCNPAQTGLAAGSPNKNYW